MKCLTARRKKTRVISLILGVTVVNTMGVICIHHRVALKLEKANFGGTGVEQQKTAMCNYYAFVRISWKQILLAYNLISLFCCPTPVSPPRGFVALYRLLQRLPSEKRYYPLRTGTPMLRSGCSSPCWRSPATPCTRGTNGCEDLFVITKFMQ